ncbi:MAG: hypothetical protein R2747_02850 [Pyrinomonadaceae bacterium]
MRIFLSFVVVGILAIGGFAQTKNVEKPKETPAPSKGASKSSDPLMDLANLTLKAHGGEKLKNLKSLTISGSVDITPSNVPQAIPASFITIFSGDKYLFELNNPFQPLKQTYDGNQTYSNVQNGFNLPPINRLGFPVISRIGDKDFVISALADDKEAKKGFRITTPEGYYTDFYVDKKTGQVKKYESKYLVNGRDVTTSVEIDKCREVEGVVIPEKYAQRFETGQFTIYAEFKAKQIEVNRELDQDIFVLKQ